MKEQLRKNFATLGEPFLAHQLNRYSTRLLLTSVATMAGTQNGLTKVRYVPKPPGKDNFREKVLYFDDKRILRRAATTTSDGSTLVESFSWKPDRTGSSLLVLDSYTSETTLANRKLTRITTHNYDRFGGWLLLKGASIKTKSLPNDLSHNDSAFANQDLVFTNIVAK